MSYNYNRTILLGNQAEKTSIFVSSQGAKNGVFRVNSGLIFFVASTVERIISSNPCVQLVYSENSSNNFTDL